MEKIYSYRKRAVAIWYYKQEVKDGRILYSVEEIEKWRENGYK